MSQTFVFLKEPNQSVNFPSLTCPVGRIDQRSGNCIFFKTANKHFLTLHVCHLCWSFTKADKPGTCLHKKQVSKLSKKLTYMYNMNIEQIGHSSEENHGISCNNTPKTSLQVYYLYLSFLHICFVPSSVFALFVFLLSIMMIHLK